MWFCFFLMFTKAKKSAIFCWNPPCLTRSGYKCRKSSGKALVYIKVLVDKSFLEFIFFFFLLTLLYFWNDHRANMRRRVMMREHRTNVFCGLVSWPCLLCDCFDTSIMLWNVCNVARRKWEIGRKSSEDMFTLFYKKAGGRHYTHTHCPFSLVVILALLFIYVHCFRQCCSYNCGYVTKHPFPLSNECGGNYLSRRTWC